MSKTVLVTGASSGIGAAFAEIAARNGYDVVLVARREDRLKSLSSALEKEHRIHAHIIVSDLTKPGEPKRVWDSALKQAHHIYILINNAGFGDYGAFHLSDAARNNEMITLNCMVLAELSQYASSAMVKHGGGRIANIASLASFLPGPNMAVYHATKAFVLSLSQAISTELVPHGVTVTAVCPGATRSEFENHAHLQGKGIFNSNRTLPSSSDVAEFGWQAIIAGKPVAIHRLSNRVGMMLARLLPWRITARIVSRSNRT